MAEQVLYPAIALCYFGLLSWESRSDKLQLGTAASLNVFCLFVLAQPFCLVIGGYQGIVIYICMAFMSYKALPRKGNDTKRTEEQEKRKVKRGKETKKRSEAGSKKSVGNTLEEEQAKAPKKRNQKKEQYTKEE